MNEFNPRYELEGLVRKITASQSLRTNSSDKKVVTVDESTGKVVTRTRPFKRYRKYLVYCDQVLKGELTDIEVEDFDSLDMLKLNITYKAHCPFENVDVLIEKLFIGSGEHPKKRLHAFLERYVEEFVEEFESTSDFFQKFYKYKRRLIKEITKKTEREIGLKLNLNIALKYENELEMIELEDGFFEVYVNNYDRGLKLKYKAQLEVDPEQKINAIIKFEKKDQLKGLFRNQIKKVLLQSVSLDDFINNYNLVKEKILKFLNERLIKEGRTISYLAIENETLVSDSEKEFILDNYKVNCKLKDSHIDITHDLIMQLTDLGKYKNSGIKSLEEWVKEKLESITKNVLFGNTYLDLILNFDTQNAKSDEKNIKLRMDAEADKIGYTVRQLITIPKVDPLELVDGFSFDVGESEEFSTLNTRIKIKLIVAVSGRIIDLKKIEKYISPNINIIEKMKDRVLLSIKQVIDKVEPERYYIRFKDFDPKLSVEKELIDVISKNLKKEFHASDIVITPKQLDTDITIRFAKLVSQFYKFNFETFPFREGGSGESVKFEVMYQVKNVHRDGWHQFQSKRFDSIEEEVDQISTLLKVNLKNTLSTIKSNEITYKTLIDVKKIKKIANLILKPIIREAFGLEINILSIERDATQLEQTFHERREKMLEIDRQRTEIEKDAALSISQNRVGELQLLMEKKEQLESIPEYSDSEELKTVRKKIEEFSTQFDDISIGDSLVDIDDIEEEGNDLDNLLSFLNTDDTKRLGPLENGDTIEQIEGKRNNNEIPIEINTTYQEIEEDE